MGKILPCSALLLLCGILSGYFPQIQAAFPYYGTKIGPLTQLHHAVSGDVYAVDSRTLFIKNFNYDGGAPAAYFYVGNTKKPGNGEGTWRLRDEKGSSTAFSHRYRNKDITLSLPEGKTLKDIKWFSVWCDEFSVNFGDVKIPANLDFPRPQKVAPLGGVHGVVSDSVVIVDAQTLLIPNFSYDGEAPDAKFWVGRGSNPSPQGLRIPDENGKETPLRRYDRKTIVLTLPGDLTVFDIGHFGVWCEAFTVDFGHIRVPEGLNVPPSLKMLGISPQSKLNCEVLYDDLAFEVRWAVAGESIVVQLVAKLDDGEYMSFGISPNKDRTVMVGADAVVAWVDRESGKGFAHDYYLDDKSQCSGKRGSCPDANLEEGTNSVRLLNAAMVNGYSIVTYQRSLKASDKLDVSILTNTTQAVVWAIGPLNARHEVSFHSKYTKGDHFIEFGRQPTWNCPVPEGEKPQGKDEDQEQEDEEEEFYENRQTAKPQALKSDINRRTDKPIESRPVPTPKPVKSNEAWEIPPIQCYEPEDGVFYAQLGPTGGKHGYPAITGHVGWGISWYINGLLIPEIHLVRGKRYTFVVEGGNDPDVPAKYHPFYITDDPVGGYEHKTPEEKAKIKIYAGIHRSRTGKITPTGVGRLCNWTPDQDGPTADDYPSFGAYQRSLTLKCDTGEPAFITWTPDNNTPDTVYYHCFTHRYLGWKIHVHDTCESAQASQIEEVYAEPEEEYVAEPSIRHETRVSPNDNFLLRHETNLVKNHNMNEAPPKVNFELSKSAEITKIIADGILAAEALEQSIKKKPVMQLQPVEILQGEVVPDAKPPMSINMNPPPEEISLLNNNPYHPSAYLTPPQNAPFYRPVQVLSSRRPVQMVVEKRPSVRPYARPVVMSQPSAIISHYRKPVAAMMRPYIMEQPYSIKPMSSAVMMLGQPNELRPREPLLKAKPKPIGIIPVSYFDQNTQDSKKNYMSILHGNPLKSKKPIGLKLPMMQEQPLNVPVTYKEPFEIKELRENVGLLKPAVNEGFKPATVVVEGGFRPIVRRRNDEEDDDELIEANSNRRRDDDMASDIDDVMETDTLFFNKETSGNVNHHFEPMFIPSPLDSTNSTIKRKTLIAAKLASDLEDMEVEEGDDKEALAAERIDTFYLPPERKKPSAIPDGAVVAYDGKAVLDKSLVSPPRFEFSKDSQKDVVKGISKIEEFVRSTPQFGPFHGEIPPLTPSFLSAENPNKTNKVQQQNPVTEYSNPQPVTVEPPASTTNPPTSSETTIADETTPPRASISTKLTLLKTEST